MVFRIAEPQEAADRVKCYPAASLETTIGRALGRPASGKYAPLTAYLDAQPAHVTNVSMKFDELESMLGSELPTSAYKYRPWWANQTDNENRPQARAWMVAGFIVDSVDLNLCLVQFARLGDATSTRGTQTEQNTSNQGSSDVSSTNSDERRQFVTNKYMPLLLVGIGISLALLVLVHLRRPRLASSIRQVAPGQ